MLRMRATILATLFATIIYSSCYAVICDLEVQVSDDQGHPIDTSVALREHDGRQSEKITASGTAKFCGLGLLPVTVEAGSGQCGRVTVRNVRLVWGKTTRIHIVMNPNMCPVETPPQLTCAALIRVTGLDGQPAADASVEVSPPLRDRFFADEYGRVLIAMIPHRTVLRTVVSAPASEPVPLTIECNAARSPLMELKAVLVRNSR